MRISVMFFLLIFSLWSTTSHSAPNDNITVPLDPKPEPKPSPTEEEQLRLKSMDVTIPKSDNKTLSQMAKSKSDDSYYYPFRQSIAPRLGLVFDPDQLRDNLNFIFLFGVMYMLPSDNNKHWEIGFDIHTGGLGYLQAYRRWVFYSDEKFRPFIRAGLSSRLKSEQGLASVVNKDNVQARIGIGFEDLMISPLSAAVAMEIAAGKDQSFLAIVIGYSWAW